MDERRAETAPTGGGKKVVVWNIAAVFIALHLILTISSARQKSVTSDEPFHIARGVSALFSGDFRMSVAHPPLINLISATPLIFFDDFQAPFIDPMWKNSKSDPSYRKYRFANFLLWNDYPPYYRGNPEPLRIVFWTRVPIMVMSAVLALAIFIFTSRKLGDESGIFALGLYCFSPTVMAHARLVTTDLGVTLFIFLFAITLVHHLKKPGWKSLILCGITLGLAELAKFTSILLLPLVPLVFLAGLPGGPVERIKGFLSIDPKSSTFHFGVVAYLLMLLIAAVVIWAGYGFEVNSIHNISAPELAVDAGPSRFLKSLIIRTVAEIPIPPRTYYFGLASTLSDTTAHSHPLYFLGQVSDKGWWYYYPVLFLMKEPLALLGLLGLAASVQVRKRPRFPDKMMTVFGILSLGLLAFFMFLNQKNIGIRHILPLYPFLFIWLSSLVSKDSMKGIHYWLARALWVAFILNGVLSYPNYLVHFNSAVGGPDGGLRLSVVGEDWGQDVSALGRWCEEKGVDEIHYTAYGNVDPKAYGVPAVKLDCGAGKNPPGYYAFHLVQLLRPTEGFPASCVEPFLKERPAAVLRHTIYVYRLDEGKAGFGLEN